MELILNTNELGYEPFINCKIDAFIVGLKGYCINQQFCFSFGNLKKNLQTIKAHQKKIYISVNSFVTENNLPKFKKMISKLINCDIDGFIVSDLGVLNIFKQFKSENKVTLDLHTYVTNKYSAKSLLNLGIQRVCLSKEITLEDIKEISNFNPNKIELLTQGYFPITYSKRPILSCYYKNFKIHSRNFLCYVKEETRNDYYPVVENNNILSVYNHKQYSLFSCLDELIENDISYLRIDSLFLDEFQIKDIISFYDNAIRLIKSNNKQQLEALKKEFLNKYSSDTPFLHSESFLLKEGK